MQNNDKPAGWQRKLRFEDEEIWIVLPASVREQCLALWRQVLVSVLKSDKGRQNERKA
jgi:hypothetical protein